MEIPSLDPSLDGGLNAGLSLHTKGGRGKDAPKTIHDVYEFGNELGKGAFGQVVKVTHKVTKVAYAAKIIDKAKCGASGLSEVFSEVEVISMLSHRYIIGLKEVFETKEHLYLVMELLLGGELAARLHKVGHFSEHTVKRFVRNMLLAVDYMHRKGIVHRDLKPANMLLAYEDDSSEVKIADFGFATLIGADSVLVNCCGTPAYMAPEIITGKPYGQAVDMWAVGIIIWHLLSKTYPFPGSTADAIQDAVVKGKYEIPEDGVWANISGDCKDLIRKLLVSDPRRRYTARDCLNHTWVRMGAEDFEFDMLDEDDDIPGLRSLNVPLRNFRKAAFVVVAANRLSYLQKWKLFRRLGAECQVMYKFSNVIHRTVESKDIDCSLSPIGNKSLPHLLEMVNNSQVVESLRFGNNDLSYDSIQNIVKASTSHPSITLLDLSGNPITTAGGRAILRLARTNHRMRTILLKGCNLSNDIITQINSALKENELRKLHKDAPSLGNCSKLTTLPSMPSPNYHAHSPSPNYRNHHESLPAMVPRKTVSLVQRLHKYQ